MIYANELERIEVIQTGTLLDKLSGIGGIPRGKITEIFGDESVGKTTLCLQAISAAQKQGFKCLWADVEFAYDAIYALGLGVDNKKVGVLRERYAELLIDTLETEIESGKWDLVVLDSIGQLLPRQEAEKSAEGRTIGGQAGLVAKFCRKIIPLIDEKKVALVVVNHSFVDLMSGKIMTSGGKKLAYSKSFSVRLKVNTKVVIKQGDRKIGKVIIGEVKKNKLAGTEGMEIDGQLIFGSGFSKSADLLAEALDAGVITKKGQMLHFGDSKLARGTEATRKMIEGDKKLEEEIKAKL